MNSRPVVRSPRQGWKFRASITGALACLALSPAHADIMIDNVDGYTLDAEGKMLRFNGLLIGDDGRVEQIFKPGDKRPGRSDFAVNGQRRVMVPGFIDAQMRLTAYGFSLVEGAPATRPRPEDRDLAFAKAQQALLERGVTAVVDMGASIEDWQTYRRAGDLGSLRMRIVAYADGVDTMLLAGGPGPTPWLYDDRLRLNGVKIAVDGPLARHEAHLKAAYADAPQKKVAPRLNDTQIKNLMSRAAIDNFQPAIEAHGDQAVSATADAIAELAQTYRGDRRWRLESVEAIDPADQSRLAAAGAVVTIAPLTDEAGLQVAKARLGPGRTPAANSWLALDAARIKVAFGSAAPLAQPDPFAILAAAVASGAPQADPASPAPTLATTINEAAFAGLTANAAYAAFADGRFGRLAQGQRADFLFLDRSPLVATPDEIRATRVLETWIGGKLAYRAKPEPAAAAPKAGPEFTPSRPEPSNDQQGR